MKMSAASPEIREPEISQSSSRRVLNWNQSQSLVVAEGTSERFHHPFTPNVCESVEKGKADYPVANRIGDRAVEIPPDPGARALGSMKGLIVESGAYT